ncbi:MAG: hypothetical protein GY788_22985 [bacterium]|nr:hypothetical protein [bacterium]
MDAVVPEALSPENVDAVSMSIVVALPSRSTRSLVPLPTVVPIAFVKLFQYRVGSFGDAP